jgi:hypothetical protein
MAVADVILNLLALALLALSAFGIGYFHGLNDGREEAALNVKRTASKG